MFAVISIDSDYEESWPVGVTIYHGISTEKEFDSFTNAYAQYCEPIQKHMNKFVYKVHTEIQPERERISKELGLTLTWEEFCEKQGLTIETIAFTID